MMTANDPPGLDTSWYCNHCGIIPAEQVEFVQDAFTGIPRHEIRNGKGELTGRCHLIGIWDPWAPP